MNIKIELNALNKYVSQKKDEMLGGVFSWWRKCKIYVN